MLLWPCTPIRTEESAMDVAAWLRDQGLGQYAEAFCQQHIDPEVLRDLTAEDVISLGVPSVGHRRRLPAAIARLGTETRQPQSAAAAQVTRHEPQPRPSHV